MRGDADLRGGFDRVRPQHRAVRIGERHVMYVLAVVERVVAPARAVDELVEDDEVARPDIRSERTDRARTDD